MSKENNGDVIDINVDEQEVEKSIVLGSWVEWDIAYLRSFPGILRIITSVLALIAFIINESTPLCNYKYILGSCRPPINLLTYHYFSAITFLTFIAGILMLIFNLTGHARIHLRRITFYFTETVILGTLAFLLAFADLFMIGSTAAQINLQVAAVFGTAAVILKGIHLTQVVFCLRKYWKDGLHFCYCDPRDDQNERERESIESNSNGIPKVPSRGRRKDVGNSRDVFNNRNHSPSSEEDDHIDTVEVKGFRQIEL